MPGQQSGVEPGPEAGRVAQGMEFFVGTQHRLLIEIVPVRGRAAQTPRRRRGLPMKGLEQLDQPSPACFRKASVFLPRPLFARTFGTETPRGQEKSQKSCAGRLQARSMDPGGRVGRVADFLDSLAQVTGVPIDGIVGTNVLRRFRVVIDYPGKVLRLD